MKKTKQELIEEAAKLAGIHINKKEVIEKIFSDLDKEQKASSKHLSGISTVNELLKEIELIEQEHAKIIEQIKEN